MRTELLHTLKRYYELREQYEADDLGSYDIMEQRLTEADHLIHAMAKALAPTMPEVRHEHV